MSSQFFAVNRVHFVVDGNEAVLFECSVPPRPCFSMADFPRRRIVLAPLADGEELEYRVTVRV